MKVNALLSILVLTLTATALSQTLPDAPEAKSEHHFFDRTNSLLMGAGAAAIAADGWSSRRMTDMGNIEQNPMARPFVGSNGGSVLYFGGSEAGLVGGMYWLPRSGHHKIEEVLPVVFSRLGTRCAVYNAPLYRQRLLQARGSRSSRFLRRVGRDAFRFNC